MESLGDVLRRTELIRTPDPGPAEAVSVCPICHGAGYLRYDVNVDDPRFGQLTACDCTRRDLERRRRERLVEKSNLGALRRMTFESFIRRVVHGHPPRGSVEAAWAAARRFAEDPDGWLVLYGHYGTGKTHLAAAIANHRLSLSEPAVFVVVPDLLDHLRSTFSPNSEVTYDELFETVRETPLLVLDDLGSQTSTPWAQEKLYQVLNHRYNKRLPTVVTMNVSPDHVEPPRLRSRLGDSMLSKLVELKDQDKRFTPTQQKPGSAPAARSKQKPSV